MRQPGKGSRRDSVHEDRADHATRGQVTNQRPLWTVPDMDDSYERSARGRARKLHSTSMPVVIPRTCRKRIDGARGDPGAGRVTAMSDVQRVGQSIAPNGRLADISTRPPPSRRLSSNRTKR